MGYVALAVLLGFAAGSIPTGYLLGLLRGVDIRQHGSGNVGATNVGRTLGKKFFIVVLIFDALKGALPVIYFPTFIASLLEDPGLLEGSSAIFGSAIFGMNFLHSRIEWLVAMGAVLGHCFTPFLRGKGGKGIATGVGAYLVLAIFPTLLALMLFVSCVVLFRIVSLASVVAALSLCWTVPLLMSTEIVNQTTLLQNWTPAIATWTIASVIIFRHRSNIKRIFDGTESKLTSKPQAAPAA